MRRNIHFNILLLLLLVEAISVRAVAQIPDRTLYQSISLDEYLKRVGEDNLNYLAEKLNVSIADAEMIAQKVLPDPEVGFEAGHETFSLGLSYSLELGNKRGARIKLARSQMELEKLILEQSFQNLRAEAASLFWRQFFKESCLKYSKVLTSICCN